MANIKILFVGKNLLNNLVLDELNVNGEILFAYIRSIEEVLLMSSKALHVDEDIINSDDESDWLK